MLKNSEMFEFENRTCPICGKFVKIDSPLHHCSDKDLQKIEEQEKLAEELSEELEDNRSFDDDLKEFDDFYNQENYYNDIKEE